MSGGVTVPHAMSHGSRPASAVRSAIRANGAVSLGSVSPVCEGGADGFRCEKEAPLGLLVLVATQAPLSLPGTAGSAWSGAQVTATLEGGAAWGSESRWPPGGVLGGVLDGGRFWGRSLEKGNRLASRRFVLGKEVRSPVVGLGLRG